jgi:hypothetical protein
MTAQHGADPLPLQLEEITPDFLTAALAESFPGATVRNFEIVDAHHGFTTVVRLRLDVDEAARAAGLPQTIMLKGGFEAFTRGKARDFSILPLGMEVNAYRAVPKLGLNMPACYFAAFDPERAQMIILMEDLAARTVTFGHGLRPYTPEQVRRRLTSLAAFHARTWDSPELKAGGRFAHFPSNGCAMFRDYMKHAGYTAQEWLRYCAMPRGAAVSTAFHDFAWLSLALEHMASLSDALPNCLVHGDTHLGNLYEEADGTPGFFDALPRREAPMIEVAYHITNALDPADRRRCDKDLVAHYRAELLRHGVPAPGLDDLLFQFASFLPNGFVTFMVNESSYQTESFNTAHTARYSAAMLDHDTKAVVEAASRTRH